MRTITLFNISILTSAFLLSSAVHLKAASLAGLWYFDNAANPAEATVGNDLFFLGVAPTYSASLADDSSNSLTGVITTAVADSANRIRSDHGIAANGGGSFVNQYSIVTDIFSPAGSRSSWRTIYQTNTANGNDGDYFIRPDNDNLGVADLTYSDSPIDETSWTRLVVTFDLTQDGGDVTTYLDGSLHHIHQPDATVDQRFSLDPSVFFFTDNDGDNAPLNVGALAIYDGVLTAGEVAALGNAGAAIPEPSTSVLLALVGCLALRRRR